MTRDPINIGLNGAEGQRTAALSDQPGHMPAYVPASTPLASTPPEPTMLDYASAYIRRGMRVFTVQPNGKTPATQHGFKDATDDLSVVATMLASTPGANLGVATGNGVLVVDLDKKGDVNGILEWERLQQEAGEEVETFRVATPGGGCHLYFAYDPMEAEVRSSAGRIASGIDIRGEGGYVVGAGSVIDGRSYFLAGDQGAAPFVPAPKWLLEMIGAAKTMGRPTRVATLPPVAPRPAGADMHPYAKAALENAPSRVAAALEGTRNDTLNAEAFMLGQIADAGGLDQTDVIAALAHGGEAAGLPAHEAWSTAQRAFVQGMDEPRPIPPPHNPQNPQKSDYEDCEDRFGRGEWFEPEPLDVPEDPPVFPTEALPAALGDFVRALVADVQVDPGLAGPLVLAVVATCTHGRVFVRIRPGHVEPTCLFVAVVLPPAERKSPTFKRVVAPLAQAERTLADMHRSAITRARTEHDALAKRAERLSKEAGQTDDVKDRRARIDEAATAAEEAYAASVPPPPRFLADDATPEALKTLAIDHGRIAIVSDEGGVVDQIAGQYATNGRPNLDVYLKGWDGGAVRVDRKGGDPSMAESIYLTIGVTFQPKVLAEARSDSRASGRGLFARFLIVRPPGRVGTRRSRAAIPVPPAVAAAYAATIEGLAVSLWDADPVEIGLSPQAHELWLDFEEEVERGLAPGGELEAVKEWGGKLPGQVARLAGILQVAENRHATQVSEDAMRRAISLGRYFSGHAVAVEATTDPAVQRAAYLLDRIADRDNPDAVFSRRDLHQRVRGGQDFRAAKALDHPLGLLIEHGYIREVASPSTSGPGRPPGPSFEVNPLWVAGGCPR